MKKLLLFSACVLLVFASCKKDSSKKTGSNTITATVGGSNMNFSTTAEAALVSDSGTYALEIVGISGTGSSAQEIGIGILSDVPIAKGTYSFNSLTDSTATIIPFIAYTKNASGEDADAFETETAINFDMNGPNSSTFTTAKVTITSISSTNVQGTFSGLLVNEADNTITENVTNGKFNVDISANNNIQSFNKRISAAKLKLQSFKKITRN